MGRAVMRWFAPFGSTALDNPVRDTPTARKFRVEPLEPRLLLSGDPLDLLKDSLEPPLIQEPAVAVSDTVNAPSPAIDWGGGVMTNGDSDTHNVLSAEQPSAPAPIAPTTPEPTVPVEAMPVDNTDAQTSTVTSFTTTVSGETVRTIVAATNPVTSHISDAHDARGPPASFFTDEETSLLSVGPADARGALRASDVLPVVDVAISRWLASNQSDAATNRLDQLSFRIVDLPGRMLGRTSGTTIQLDATAAGYRWFVDPSPSSSDEFEPTDTATLSAAQPGSPARGRMDLLTVVEHEIGHVLGFRHDDPIAPMADVLVPGRRVLLPTVSIDGSATAVDAADSAPAILDLSDETGSLTLALAPDGDVIVSGAFADAGHNSTFGGVEGIVSGAGDDTLVGPGLTNLWTITGANAGTLTAGSLTPLTFAGVENLSGGDSSDTFAMTPDGGVSGVVNGGAGSDTLVGDDTPNTWVIDGSEAGTLNGQSFAGVENLTGGASTDTFRWMAGGSVSGVVSGGPGNDTLVGADIPNTWTLTGVGAGTLNGQAFAGIENLVGGADSDRFVFAGGSVTGRIDGGGGLNTLDYAADALGVTVDLTAGAATGTAGTFGIGAVVGGSGSDTLIGPASGNTWTITDTDTGTVNTVTFRRIESLVGGSESDTFVLGPSGKITGRISGGDGDDVLVASDSPNAWTVSGPDAGTLNGLPFSVIETAQGGASEDIFVVTITGLLAGALLGGLGLDRLRGPDQRNAWRVTSRNAGKLNQQGFSGIESLTGGSADDEFVLEDGVSVDGTIEGGAGADTLSTEASQDAPIDNTWNITGANAGRVNGVSFGGFENLSGAAGNQDTFVFDTAGTISGVVEGGAGGFDSIVLNSVYIQTVTYTATGRDSGTIARDGDVITYSGFEPMVDPAGGNRVVNAPAGGADRITLRDVGAVADNQFIVASTTFESVTFTNAQNITTLTVNAGDLDDVITLEALDTRFSGRVTINADAGDDEIVVNALADGVVYTLNGGGGADDRLRFSSQDSLTLTDTVISSTELRPPRVDINITRADGDQTETTLAVNPVNPQNMIMAVNDIPNISAVNSRDAVWFTRDGGATWSSRFIPLTAGSGGQSRGDPSIVFSRDGSRAVYSHMLTRPGGGRAMATAVSLDGGDTWPQTGVVGGFAGAAPDDKEFLAVGPDVANLARDIFVMAYHSNNIIFVSTSPDGVAWTAPVRVSDAGGGIDSIPMVGPNGEIYVVWEDFNTAGRCLIRFDVSLDGGATWRNAPPANGDIVAHTGSINPFNDPFSGGRYHIPAQPDRLVGLGLSGGVDRSGGPHNGRIYVAFADQADLTPGSANAADHDNTDIFVIASDDRGLTWNALGAAPVRVNHDGGINSQFHAWMDVDQRSGNVAVSWYDARNDTGAGSGDTNGTANDDVQRWASVSFDSGRTFPSNVQISDGASNGHRVAPN